MDDITGLLLSWREGDERALHRLMPLVYDELRRVARRQLRRESPAVTIQPTALVHEVYLSVAAALMRRILVDQARRRHTSKRGGGVTMMHLDEVSPLAPTSDVDLLALDEALEALASIDPRQCRVVELRFFAGLTTPETAAALAVSTATVEREWAFAKAWLLRRLSPTE
jgi:RNA polymerase sigma-70 factor (ECF subfamily)